MQVTFFSNRIEFRKWLLAHHNTEKEILVGYYKVNTGKPSMTWSDSVDEALCFGWIDSVRRSINEESYCIRFTPRKPNSIWSNVNITKVEELTRTGMMQKAGLDAFGKRKNEKSGIYSFENDNRTLDSSLEMIFQNNISAWNFFVNQPPSYQKSIIHWIQAAKQEKTRISRLEKAIAASAEKKRIF